MKVSHWRQVAAWLAGAPVKITVDEFLVGMTWIIIAPSAASARLTVSLMLLGSACKVHLLRMRAASEFDAEAARAVSGSKAMHERPGSCVQPLEYAYAYAYALVTLFSKI